MVLFTRKVHRKLRGNFTFLILTDLDDLDTQIYKTFAGCVKFVVQANSFPAWICPAAMLISRRESRRRQMDVFVSRQLRLNPDESV